MAGTFNRGRLFWLGILALFTAAAGLAVRGAIASGLKSEWIDPIAPLQAGELIAAALGAAFLSFAITLFVASAFLDQIGMKRCLVAAGLCFFAGPLLIVTAGHLATGMTIYTIVWVGMLLSGIGWGLTEAAINPLTTQLYFPGEEANERDGIFDHALLLDIAQAPDGGYARFDFVVA